MIYLLLALIIAFAPANIKTAEIAQDGKLYFRFLKVSDSQWKGTHESGKEFTFTINGNTIQKDNEKPEDVINRVSLKHIKTIPDLRNMGDVDKGSHIWKIYEKENGLVYAREPKDAGTGGTSYSITWSQ